MNPLTQFKKMRILPLFFAPALVTLTPGLGDHLLVRLEPGPPVLRFPVSFPGFPIRNGFRQQGWISLEIDGLVMSKCYAIAS